MEWVHQFSWSHLELASNHMKRYYDASVWEMSYKGDDPVWFYNPQRKKGISPKFQRLWHGPYIVLKKINDVIYRVQLSPHTKPKVIHHNRLAPYQGQNIQNWLQNQDARQQQASEIMSVRTPSATNMQSETNVRTGKPPRNNSAEFPKNDKGELVPPLRRSGRQRAPPKIWPVCCCGRPKLGREECDKDSLLWTIILCSLAPLV